MGLLTLWPWLALVPGAALLALSRRGAPGVVRIAGLLWLIYAAYEYAMQRRWLCSGECNIRVDLLLIYPLLLGMSLAAVRSLVRARAGRRAAG
jgi:hypothetical protein